METEAMLQIMTRCATAPQTLSNSATDLQGFSQILPTALLSSQSRLYGVLDHAAHVIHVAQSSAGGQWFDVLHQDLTQGAKDLQVSQDEDPVKDLDGASWQHEVRELLTAKAAA